MRHNTLPQSIALALLVLSLAGCGGKGEPSSGNGTASTSGGTSSAMPGAESPEALVARAKSLVASKDMHEIVGLIAPDERPLMSVGMLMLSKMAPMMIGGLGAAMGEGMGAAMGAGSGGKVTGEALKAQLAEKMKPYNDAIAATMKKHGLADVNLDEAAGKLQTGTPEAAVAWIKEKVPNLDHAAFVADVLGAITKLGGKAGKMGTQGFTKLQGDLTNVKIDGDHATGTIGENATEFVKVAGRWYFSIKNDMGR